MKKFLKTSFILLTVIIYSLIALIFIDFVILRMVFNIGIPVLDSLGTKSYRIPAAYTGFVLDRLMEGQSSYDKVKFFKSGENTLKIAFFGGSTGEHLNEEYLNKKFKEYFKQDVELRNLSCASSHHRQHLHMILEILPKYNPDIIVFYGGVNELTQPLGTDPRPGYPYNYYYKSETSPFKQFLIENSAIVSELEYKKRNISSLLRLQKEYSPNSEEWWNDTIHKYFETLDLANRVSSSLNSNAYGKTKFIAFYQPYKMNFLTLDFSSVNNKVRKEIKNYNYIVDIHDEFNGFSPDIWVDYCHVKADSGANEHIIDVMAKITADRFAKNN